MIRCNRKAVKIFDSMKVKDLLKALERVDPEAEVIGGVWNGRVDTYKVMDDTQNSSRRSPIGSASSRQP